ncbi:TPA: hypothetical protein ACHP1R_000647, partial [Raoultella ornithinolytica]|jgi:hypothetical protein
MMKSVAQLPLKPINYDGVHALPINECVKNAAHETDLGSPVPIQIACALACRLSATQIIQSKINQRGFVCSVTLTRDNQNFGGIFYTQRQGMSLV